MHYQVSRNGQIYGPYTLEDLQRYLASGNVLPNDLAKSESMSEWLPVAQILSGQAGAGAVSSPGAPPYAGQVFPSDPAAAALNAQGAVLAASPYPDPPNLGWGIYLLLSILTCGLFSKVFTVVQAVWLKKVQPNSNGLIFYVATYVMAAVNMVLGYGMWMGMMAHHGSVYHGNYTRGPLGLLYFLLLIATRFVMSTSIEEHFNGPEPIGLRLNPVMVFFFGGVYFQYHFNKIVALKQASRYGMGRAL